MNGTNMQFNSLYDLYRHLGVSVSLLRPNIGFTIFNLKDVGLELPYESPLFRHNYFSFLFVKNGIGKYSVDGFVFHIKPRTIYFANPGNYRTFSWYKIDDVYLITFDEIFLKENVSKDVLNEFPFLFTEVIRPEVATEAFFVEIEGIYLQIHKEYINYSPNQSKIIGHLLSVLLYKIKEYSWKDYDPIYEGRRSSQIVKCFKQLLEKHYQDLSEQKAESVFRIQDYADALHLHPSYLSNVIKSKTGKPISTWISEKTMSEAKSLLKDTSVPIKVIMSQLGFSEASHFSNYFKKYTNLSPAQFRKDLKTKS